MKLIYLVRQIVVALAAGGGAALLLAGCAVTEATVTTVAADTGVARAEAVAGGSVESYYEFSLGVQAEFAGNYAAAVDHLQRALNYDSGAVGIHAELGYLCLQLGRPGEAIQHYRPVLAADPRNYQNNLRLGNAYLAAARYAEALSCFTVAALDTEDRRDGKAQFYVAVVQTMAGNYLAAATAYERYLVVVPDDAVGWYNLGVLYDGLGQDSLATQALERTVELEPESARALARLALFYRQQERLPDAAALIRRAIVLEPAIPAHRLLLADLATELEDFTEAVAQYRQVLAQTPHDIRAQFQLGLVYARQKDYPRAIEALRRCLVLDPELITPYIELGYLYQMQGDLEASVAVFQQGLKVDPRNSSLYELLGLTQEARHDTDAARAAYRSAIAADPRHALNARYHLAGLEFKSGDYAAAELGYRAVLEQNPNYAPALNDLAYMYIERKIQLATARDLVTRALQLAPDNACYLDSLGWLDFQEGDYVAAARSLERAAALSDDAEILYHLGEVYYQLGRFADARAVWSKALAGREDARLRRRLAELPDAPPPR